MAAGNMETVPELTRRELLLAAKVDTSKRKRSAVTNGSRAFIVGDGNSPWYRRWKDLLALHVDDLGGPESLSEAQLSLARRAATLEVELERIEGQLSLGNDADLDAYECAMPRRPAPAFSETLGIQRAKRVVNNGDGVLADYSSASATPKSRRAMRKLITLREALQSPEWLGGMPGRGQFRDHARAAARAAMGRAFDRRRTCSLFVEATQRAEAPTQPAEEFWWPSRLDAAARPAPSAPSPPISAGCVDYRAILWPRRARRPAGAGRLDDASAGRRSISSRRVSREFTRFAALVDGVTADTILAKNPCRHPDLPGVLSHDPRLFGAVAVIAEECSMWQSERLRLEKSR